jgi:hypothetical protein
VQVSVPLASNLYLIGKNFSITFILKEEIASGFALATT